MSKLRIDNFSISLDGFGAGPAQDLGNPLGAGGMELHGWLFKTRAFQKMLGQSAGETGVDNDFITRSMENIGAWIMGRNMFGPVRGEWPDEGWTGWWGDEPPYHTDVFVLTHHARAPVAMKGGTTFHFVTDGIHAALERARTVAGGRDIRIGGGAQTIRQYLEARLVDEMHLAITSALLGGGEHLLGGLNLPALGYSCTRRVSSADVCHVVLTKR